MVSLRRLLPANMVATEAQIASNKNTPDAITQICTKIASIDAVPMR
jgi:hypothetical protein